MVIKKYKVKRYSGKTYIVAYRKKVGWGYATFNILKSAIAYGKRKSSIFIIYPSSKYTTYIGK